LRSPPVLIRVKGSRDAPGFREERSIDMQDFKRVILLIVLGLLTAGTLGGLLILFER